MITLNVQSAPSAAITARNVTLGVVLACVGPRPRDPALGEQEKRGAPHLQLRPHKQPKSRRPDVLCVAHPHRPQKGEASRLPSHSKALAPGAPGACGFYM